jgi:diadenosine tetraphosphate (Ap4A) HIT family hydrolase
MAAAVEEKEFRPGMVSVVQTLGEGAKFHAHVHALVSGGWLDASGRRTVTSHGNHRMCSLQRSMSVRPSAEMGL